jgi:hypothetical protein
MRDRLIRLAGRLYPASWSRRYGVEFEALIEDASRDWRDVLDVLLGTLKMQLTTWSFGKIAPAFGVAGALLCGGMSFIAMPDQYTSWAVLRLQMAQTPTTDEPGEFVASLMQKALTRASLADIINKQGLYQRERVREPMEDVIDSMRHDIRFERIGQSNAFRVAFSYGNAEQARRTERELIYELIAANVVNRRADMIGANHMEWATRWKNVSAVEVLDSASLPQHPSSPNRILIASEGLAGGLVLGALTAVVVRTRPSTAPGGNSPKSS